MRTILATIYAVLLASGAAIAQDFLIVTVMNFNVENLFDREDDPANTGHDTYRPLQSLIQ